MVTMKQKRTFFLLSLILLLFLSLFSGCHSNSDSNSLTTTSSSSNTSSLLTIHYLDVGQGSAVLMEQDGHYMLYDGGPGSSSSFLVSYLSKLHISQLDYIIVSHYDSDHLSGIIGVLNNFSVQTLLAPDYQPDTKLYRSFLKTCQNKSITPTVPITGTTYSFANTTFQIVSPLPDSYNDLLEEENNQSIGIRLSNGAHSFLFLGDLQSDGEKQLTTGSFNLKSTVYYVSHHGSKTSSSSLLLEKVKPEYAIISVGQNSYGHPSSSVLSRLNQLGCQIFRTDLQGTILSYSDGQTLTFNTISWKESDLSDSDVTFILNTRSKKFHQKDCDAILDMNEQNKSYSTLSKEALKKQGYSPCKKCLPEN